MSDDQQSLPVTIIVCRRGPRRRAAPCSVPGCSASHERLCDFPLKGKKAGQTCDAKLCLEHATRVGLDRDYCPPHAKLAKRESSSTEEK